MTARSGFLVSALLLAGCASSGTDVVDTPVPGVPRPPLLAEPAAGSGPAAWKSSEYFASRGLDAIRAAEGYAARSGGLPAGQGVRVAIVDGGIDLQHPDVEVRQNFVFEAEGAVPDRHATHVASIVGARRDGFGVHGVAYNADLVGMQTVRPRTNPFLPTSFEPVDVAYAIASAGGIEKRYAGDVLRDPATGAPIIEFDFFGNPHFVPRLSNPAARSAIVNLSLGGGSPVPVVLEAMQDAAATSTLMVLSTGNDGSGQPVFPARYVIEPGVQGHGVAVGAVDPATLQPAPFSNWCGVTADWCLVAPGVDIWGADAGGGYVQLSGTSMAAPHVAGALAVLRAAFPSMSPTQVLQRMLATASPMNAPVARVGRGLLDLERAMAPVGPLAIETASGPSPLPGSSLAMDPALGTAGLAASLDEIVARDEHGFPFGVQLGGLVVRRGGAGHLEARLQPGTTTGVRFGRDGVAYLSPADRSRRPGSTSDAIAFAAPLADGWRMAVVGGGTPAGGLRLVQQRGAVVDDALALPFEARIGEASGLTLATDGGLSVGLHRGRLGEDDAQSIRADLVRPLGERAWARLGLGQVDERASLVGSSGRGALALAGSRSRHLSLAAGIELWRGAELVASWTRSVTESAGGTGVVREVSDVHADAFGLGLGLRSVLRAGDRLVLQVGQPLRAYRGSALVAAPAFESSGSRVVMRERRVGLAPDGRELRLAADWRTVLQDGALLEVGLFARRQPDHVRAADPDVGGLVKLRRRL